MTSREKFLSIVAPLFNEEGNVDQLHKEIVETLEANDLKGEIIFVDDGSSDGTLERAKKLSPLKLIVFRKNFGQTAAMDAGIKKASGDIIITMDSDLQNDPADIPRLLDKMDEGYDVVSGWRKNRQDNFSKKFLSRGADWLRKFLINDKIHDSGCSLKAYKKECFIGVDLYGEMHRFIPAVLMLKGFKIGELVVNHRSRRSGRTKYNYKRVLKGFLDMLSVWFWRKFSTRPLHLFGGMGLLLSILGSGILVWMFIDRLFRSASLGNRIWPMIGVFLVMIGVQFFIFGLLADILIKTYHQTKNETAYDVKEIIEN
ncbi:MAG: glycosyltransferase family 2 protein [Candidatus Moranbacteria bacterium]|jgi:glycosyltransferase involved in cell wall biosynthesis|nr:glycosyltransferase family 2 protein [Candidatus Moranbacteria bacterium]